MLRSLSSILLRTRTLFCGVRHKGRKQVKTTIVQSIQVFKVNSIYDIHIQSYSYMRYMLYHVSQVAVITPRDAGRRICETQLRRSVCCRVAKTGGMDSQVPFKSHPGHTRLLIGVGHWVGHTSHTFIFGYRNLNRLSPCLQGPFVPCHWWQCELHR